MHHTRRRSARLTRWTALVALAALYGCAGSGVPLQDTAADNTLFGKMQADIFNQHCLSAGCHNAQSQAGGMNLSAGASYASLVNAVPNNAAAQSAGLLRVQPFDPTKSFLLVKLTGPGQGEGSRMPLGMDPLPQSDIDLITSWILAGAPLSGTTGPTPTPTPALPPATATLSPTPADTVTITPTPADTGTATATVTGSPPATSTPTDTPSPSPTPTATPTFSQFEEIQTTIFNTTCTDAFCHDTQGMTGGLVLVAGQSYGNLVNVRPQNQAALQAGLLRVDPGHPENSFIIVKLEGPTDPAEGSQMPFGKTPLSAAQIQLISDWIAAGAPP
jgi:hypothetical protein